jgi:hypothetical protein
MRFFWLCILLAGTVFTLDSISTASVLQLVENLKTSDAPGASLPTHSQARLRSAVLLPGALDACWYVVFAEEALRAGHWRTRETFLDNAPKGREVHWSSLVVWGLQAVAWGLSLGSGRPVIAEVQNAPLYFGFVSFFVCSLVVGGLVMRRFGWALSGFAVLAMSTSFPFYDMFRAGEADHHGLAAAMAMAAVFCLAAGGGGWAAIPGRQSGKNARGEEGRWWFAMGGFFGGVGMWISASTIIPVLAACGVGAFLAFFAGPVRGSKLELRPEHWWVWAKSGAGTALALYLLEYFPRHMGWRLEVNHPLFAAAWVGGGWLLFQTGKWVGTRRGAFRPASDESIIEVPRSRSFGPIAANVLAVMAVFLPMVLVVLFRAAVFAPADPFLLALHEEYIREFAPSWVAYAGEGWLGKLGDVFWWTAFSLGGLAVLLFKRKALSPVWRAPLVIAFTVAGLLQIEGILQIRWAGLCVALWIGCAVLLVAICLREKSQLGLPRPVIIGFAAWAALGAIWSPIDSFRMLLATRGDNSESFPKMLAPTLLLRDIAHRIVLASPERLPIVLSDPTSSTDLVFYGGVRVLGTLYWENMAGLKRAARIFASTSEPEARKRLLEAGVNYLVMPSWDAFARLDAYAPLLARIGETSSGEEPFLARVLDGREWPDWVRPIYYPIPATFGLEGASVKIFEIVPNQTRFQAVRNRGVYHFDAGELRQALKDFEQALAIEPGNKEISRWIPALKRKIEEAPSARSP